MRVLALIHLPTQATSQGLTLGETVTSSAPFWTQSEPHLTPMIHGTTKFRVSLAMGASLPSRRKGSCEPRNSVEDDDEADGAGWGPEASNRKATPMRNSLALGTNLRAHFSAH